MSGPKLVPNTNPNLRLISEWDESPGFITEPIVAWVVNTNAEGETRTRPLITGYDYEETAIFDLSTGQVFDDGETHANPAMWAADKDAKRTQRWAALKKGVTP